MNNAIRGSLRLDWDALFTFALSVLLMLLSAGIAVLPALIFVYRTAKNCPDQTRAADLILVFGKKLRRGEPDEDHTRRLCKAAQILRAFPHARAILMGGSAAPGEISEAEAGRIYLSRVGVPNRRRILLEQDSKHTLENLRNARAHLAEMEGRHALLLSSRYHLARCSLLAESLSMKHRICAADERLEVNLANASKLLSEALFVHWFKTGRRWAKLTGNRRMLSRIT